MLKSSSLVPARGCRTDGRHKRPIVRPMRTDDAQECLDFDTQAAVPRGKTWPRAFEHSAEAASASSVASRRGGQAVSVACQESQQRIVECGRVLGCRCVPCTRNRYELRARDTVVSSLRQNFEEGSR